MDLPGLDREMSLLVPFTSMFLYLYNPIKHSSALNHLILEHPVHSSAWIYLVVLVRGDRDEGRLMKDVSAVGGVLGSKGVVFISFDDVESGLVLVHRVQDNLRKERNTHSSFKIVIATLVSELFFRSFPFDK